MEELIKKLQEGAGLGEDAARKVVGIVSEFMKEKLPGNLGDQITGVLGGGLDQVGDLADKAGDIARNLGDLLKGENEKPPGPHD